MKKNSFIIISQFDEDYKSDNHSHQLSLPLGLPQKPQIISIPGTSVKEPRRYRVTLNGEILGDKLTSDEAIGLVKQGGKA